MAKKPQVNPSKRRKVVVKTSNRPRAPSSSSSSDGGSSDDEGDKAAMLAALQAHTRAMFGLDGPDEAESSAQGRKRSVEVDTEESSGEEDEDEGEEFDSDDGWGEGDQMVTDSEDEVEAPPESKSVAAVPEVVFAETGRSAKPAMSNSERRAFLKGTSAKMMGIKATPDFIPRRAKRALEGTDKDDEEEEDESSNLKLDKTLHNMLLTTLLPTSEADSAQRPVDKRKAINGRLLELSSYQLPGEGSKSLTASQMSKHSAKIRTGILHAQEKREKNARIESEAAGSFVRGLGGLKGEGRGFKSDKGRGQRAGLGEDVGKKKGMASRKDQKRERGLGLGFGKFEGGMLRLSESDIARGSGEQKRGGKSFGGGKKKRR